MVLAGRAVGERDPARESWKAKARTAKETTNNATLRTVPLLDVRIYRQVYHGTLQKNKIKHHQNNTEAMT